MKHYIDADAWIKELEQEKAETKDLKKQGYITSLIAKIICRPKVEMKEVEK